MGAGMSDSRNPIIEIYYQNTRIGVVTAEGGENLLSVLQKNGMVTDAPCNGSQKCGKCKVLVRAPEALRINVTGVEKSLLSPGEIEEGGRLACCIMITSDMTVQIPEMAFGGYTQILTDGLSDVELSPSVRTHSLLLEKPNLEDIRSDIERLEDALSPASISQHFELYRQLPDLLRSHHFLINSRVFEDRIIALSCGEVRDTFGIAIDIGTTTLAGYLINLSNGEELETYAAMNPQRVYGSDVVSRIEYTTRDGKGLDTLTGLIRQVINRMIGFFIEKCNLKAEDIYHIVVSGNTVMTHLLCGFPVQNITESPFIPVVNRRCDFEAHELGISMSSFGIVTVMPGVSAYIGSDTVACLLSSGMFEDEDTNLLIDIGTNGEMVIGNRNRMFACSAAAGPAFEGAQLYHGMCALPGAISAFIIKSGALVASTIQGMPATGICGSGYVDAIANMRRLGMIDESGKILDKAEYVNGYKAIRVACNKEKNIYITQKDIRDIQMAKAAIAAGIEIIGQYCGVKLEDIKNVYLAGGFGNYILPENAIAIGLLPKVTAGKIKGIGNGAGAGAKMALKSARLLNDAQTVSQNVKVVELALEKSFQKIFIERMYL